MVNESVGLRLQAMTRQSVNVRLLRRSDPSERHRNNALARARKVRISVTVLATCPTTACRLQDGTSGPSVAIIVNNAHLNAGLSLRLVAMTRSSYHAVVRCTRRRNRRLRNVINASRLVRS